jgi:hypothetical protein
MLDPEKQELGGLVIVDGNPGRVSIPSRDATLPATPAGSARGYLAHLGVLTKCG